MWIMDMAGLAAARGMSVRILVDDLSYQTKYAPYDVAHYYFARLC